MVRTLVILGCMLVTTAGFSQSAKKPLSDAALDNVTAAGVSATVSKGVVKFQGEVPTANGLVTSTGTLAVLPAGSTNLSSLTLSGNAQQNLNSLININAVNSKINVLLNLNVNINSTVGQVSQSNLNGKP